MTTIKHNPSLSPDQQTKKDLEHQLILFNDDVHSFEFVIDALMEVCQHTVEQATQCTMLTHYKGLCDVKRGKFNTLRKMRKALIEKELVVHIQ